VVGQWVAEVQAEKVTAEARLRQLTGRKMMTTEEIAHLVNALGNIVNVLREADPADKAEVYRHIGLSLTYQPEDRLIEAEARPNGSCTSLCPRGDLNPHAR
jgi:site-specific DNA recombinase